PLWHKVLKSLDGGFEKDLCENWRDLDAGDVIPGFKKELEVNWMVSLESDDDEFPCTWSECNEVFHEDHLFLAHYTIKPAHIFYG
ncbi:hypothetical protein ROZALSC1DRAFT_28299, partial [Rozella allomycis CSF55]